jgi:hypothetical protein
VGQRNLAGDVLGHVRGNPGGAFGPGDPEAAVGIEGGGEPLKASLELGSSGEEGNDHVHGRSSALLDSDAVGKLAQRALETVGSAREGGRVSLLDAELLGEWRSGVAGHAGSVTATTKLSRVTDEGHAIHYTAVERGTPVYSSDDVEVGTVHQVVDNYREHILDGIVLKGTDGAIRFVDAPEVARTFERAVRLTIPADEVAQLPPPERGPGSFRANVRGGRLSRLFGGGWKRG